MKPVKLKTSYEDFAREFVEFLLADKDSAQVSKKMGYKFNIVRRWILGTRLIKWNEFLHFSDVIGMETDAILTSSLAFICINKKEREQILRFLRNQWGHLNTAKLAKILAVDVTVLNKYLNGSRAPSLSIVLKFLNLRKGSLESFIVEFTKGHPHPWQYLTDFHDREVEVFKQLGADAVFACISLKAYQNLDVHSSEFISQKVKLSIGEVDKILTMMTQQKVIEFRNGKFECIPNYISTTGASVEQLKANHIYWQKRCIEMLQSHSDGPLHKGEFPTYQSHMVFHVSEDALQKIYAQMKAYNSKILNILETQNEPPYVDVRILISSFLSTSDLVFPSAENKITLRKAFL